MEQTSGGFFGAGITISSGNILEGVIAGLIVSAIVTLIKFLYRKYNN